MGKSELIKLVQDLAKELGRPPKFREAEARIIGFQSKVRKHFGTFKECLSESGIDKQVLRAPVNLKQNELTLKNENKLIKQYQKICETKAKIQGFFRTTLDLSELFARAGNPSVLKLSAQPDTHAKFVDIPAFKCYLKFLKYYQPDVHLIMGDFVDCEGLSHWPAKDMEPRRIVPEMKVARSMLEELVNNTDKCTTRLYLRANHEAWIEQALQRMPELFEGLEDLGLEINLRKLLNLEKYGYQDFEENILLQIGKAHFTHGIYTSSNHAKKHLDVFKANIFYGHLHDIQSFGQTSMDGPMISACLGCLCRLDAKFLKGRPNNWQHASGVFEFFPDGTFNYMVPLIHNGRMAYNGLVFDGNID